MKNQRILYTLMTLVAVQMSVIALPSSVSAFETPEMKEERQEALKCLKAGPSLEEMQKKTEELEQSAEKQKQEAKELTEKMVHLRRETEPPLWDKIKNFIMGKSESDKSSKGK